MLSIITLLPLLLVIPSALASPVAGPRAVTLASPGHPGLFPDGIFNEEIAKRDVLRIIDKYQRRGQHEKAVRLAGKRRNRKRAVATVPMTDLISDGVDQLYLGALSIGTPPQTLPVVFDSGSADLWVTTACLGGCPSGYFHANESRTYKNYNRSASSTYPTGTIAGKIGTDTVTVGGLTIKNQFFTAVTSLSAGFDNSPFVGILGLSFQSMASYDKPTFLDRLIAANKLSANLFSFYLATGSVKGSELMLGGINSKHYKGAITTFSVVTETYWDIKASSYLVNGKLVSRAGIRAAIDTGSSASFLPAGVAAAIYGAIPGSKKGYYDDATGLQYWLFPCNAPLRVGFTFTGSTKVFTQKAEDLKLATYGDGYCYGSIYGIDISVNGSPISLLGIPFLKSWYSIYNLDGASGPTVSFAASKA